MSALKGPWEAHRGLDYAVVMLPGECTDNASIQVSGDDALLALIAAAPALLDALQKLVRDARPSNWDDDEDLDHWNAWLAADAAITRATGDA